MLDQSVGCRIVTSAHLFDTIEMVAASTPLSAVLTQPRPWQQIAIWMTLPYLRAIANRLHRTWGTDRQDLGSEVVVGFLEALRQVDLDGQHLGQRLWWNTYRIARRMCRQDACIRVTQAAPPTSPISPDTVTADRRDAQTIESERLGSLATRLGLRAVIANHQANTATGSYLPAEAFAFTAVACGEHTRQRVR